MSRGKESEPYLPSIQDIRVNVKALAELERKYGQICVESIEDRLRAAVETENAIAGVKEQPRYNAVTEAAMEEARKIARGELKVKSYSTAAEFFAEAEAEDEEQST